ncbi:MAG: nucleotidyltransferase family protein [Ruminococcaceae bacterium]|nr:nucleotidyltransferase family protein [Oscillospiraceae bacterium]
MKVYGIVAEYNPFHNGHKYLVDECRRNGATHIVAVMSGNFVQRGSVAIMDKRARAKAALLSGIDLVLELPLPWAVATAELFARGGVSVLSALGCVDTLAFGTETADETLLRAAAEAVCDIKVHELISKKLTTGITYATAREDAVRELYGGDIADILKEPNNILAVEYMKALKAMGDPMSVFPVERIGASHDSLKDSGEFSSASALRIMLERGDRTAFSFMPRATAEVFLEQKEIGKAPACFEESERAILSRLRQLTLKDIKKAPDVSEGLENRIFSAIESATSLEELYNTIKTKRYTHSRIRRIITSLYLGILPSLAQRPVPYIRVLGFSEVGREVLKKARKSAKLPVIMKAAQIEEQNDDAKDLFDLECKATNLYNLATPRILPCGTELTDEVVMI